MRKKRVLLLDCCSSGGASAYLGLADEIKEEAAEVYSVADLLARKPFAPLRNHAVEGLDLLPATARLSFLEPELYRDPHGVKRLQQVLEPIEKNYDFVIADSPPHLGVLMIASAIACPDVIVPINLDIGSMPMTINLHEYVLNLQQTVQPSLRILGVLGTFFEQQSKTPREMLVMLKKLFGDRMFETFIHRRRAVGDAAGVGRPIVLANPSDRGAQEYNRFTDEVLSRVNY